MSDKKQYDIIPRKDLPAEWRKDYKAFKQMAQDEQQGLAGFLNVISPAEDSRSLPNALHTIMQKERLQMEATRHAPASRLKDFMAREDLKELFYADMDDYYESCFDMYATEATRAPASLGGLTAGDPFRPYSDMPVMERKRKAPRLRLNQIVGTTDTVTGVDIRQPEYKTPPIHEQMQNVGEGGEIPVATIKLGSRQVTLKKVALGIRWTYEFARNSETRVDQLRRWVNRVAIEHEIALVKEGLETILSTVDGDANHVITGKSYSVESITTLLFELDEPYTINTLVGGPTSVVKYLNVDTGGTNLAPAFFAAMNPQLFPNPGPLNNIQLPTQYGVIKEDLGPASGASDAANTLKYNDTAKPQLLMFDSDVTLGYVRQLNSETDELDTDPSQQFVTRYLSRYYGFYLSDLNGRMKVVFA